MTVGGEDGVDAEEGTIATLDCCIVTDEGAATDARDDKAVDVGGNSWGALLDDSALLAMEIGMAEEAALGEVAVCDTTVDDWEIAPAEMIVTVVIAVNTFVSVTFATTSFRYPTVVYYLYHQHQLRIGCLHLPSD
jgi:hypothetical protein